MKILCQRCQKPVAMTIGRLVQIKRGKDRFSVQGDEFQILATCSGDCGEETAIIMENGKIQEDGLLIEGKTSTDNPPKGDQDGN